MRGYKPRPLSERPAAQDKLADLMSGWSNLQPVFVLGSPRSGTTLLAGVLNRFAGVHIARETQFVPDLYTPDADKLEGWSDRRLQRLLDEVNAYLRLNRWASRAELAGLRRSLESQRFRNYAGLVAYVWQLDQTGDGNPSDIDSRPVRFIGDNSPRYVMAIPLLQHLFPDAGYIHIVRDGRDVVSSVLGKRFGGNSLLVAARAWQEHVGCWQLAKQTIDAHRRMEVRYEDLVHRQSATIDRLAEFLQIESICSRDDEAGEEKHAEQDAGNADGGGRYDAFGIADAVPHHARLKQPIDASSVGRYRRELSAAQIRTLESLIYAGLTAYGYDVGPWRPSPVMQERNVMITGSHLLDLSRRLIRRAGRCR